MLLSKSIKNHIKIWKSIKIKNSNFIKLVICYRNGNYGEGTHLLTLIYFFIWYFILNIMPDNFSLKLFLSLRTMNMFLEELSLKRN